MQYQEFVNRVNERIGAGCPGEAEYAIRATLATLGEHLSGTEAEDLGARLPVELEAQLTSGNYAETAKEFPPAEFYRRVSEREGSLGAGDGGEHARVVLAVLSEAVGGADLREALSPSARKTTTVPSA